MDYAGSKIAHWQGLQPTDRKPGDLRMLDLGGGVSMDFCWIPPGRFLMGSPDSEPDRFPDEGPQHEVHITKGFGLAQTPATQAQWKSVMGSDPSSIKGADRPVERVSWEDCSGFIGKLSLSQGESLRLPTEAEWEYSCRAGTTTP